jgi:hypothetical protein
MKEIVNEILREEDTARKKSKKQRLRLKALLQMPKTKPNNTLKRRIAT